jgi:hypothetical protein
LPQATHKFPVVGSEPLEKGLIEGVLAGTL